MAIEAVFSCDSHNSNIIIYHFLTANTPVLTQCT